MKPDIRNTLPGYNINEYLLVLSPPEDLWQKIVKVKQEFAASLSIRSCPLGKATYNTGQLCAI